MNPRAVCQSCGTEQRISRKAVMPGQPTAYIVAHRDADNVLCTGRIGERVRMHRPTARN